MTSTRTRKRQPKNRATSLHRPSAASSPSPAAGRSTSIVEAANRRESSGPLFATDLDLMEDVLCGVSNDLADLSRMIDAIEEHRRLGHDVEYLSKGFHIDQGLACSARYFTDDLKTVKRPDMEHWNTGLWHMIMAVRSKIALMDGCIDKINESIRPHLTHTWANVGKPNPAAQSAVTSG